MTPPPYDWENEPPAIVAERAARRAIEAISRVGTLTSDLRDAQARIAALEASQADLTAILGEVLAIIEGSASG